MLEKVRILDYLQNFNFHAFDLSIPLPGITVFTPTFGFNSITSPSVSLGIEEISEGNYEFKHKVYNGDVEVEAITFTRGVKLIDSDFWRWVVNAITGYKGYEDEGIGGKIGQEINQFIKKNYKLRRDILVVQFTGANWDLLGIESGVSSLLSTMTAGILNLRNLGLARIPGKAWLLKNCIPMDYKAGSDLSADSEDISIAELTVACEYFEEWGLI
jgi:phage tail-like protein